MSSEPHPQKRYAMISLQARRRMCMITFCSPSAWARVSALLAMAPPYLPLGDLKAPPKAQMH